MFNTIKVNNIDTDYTHSIFDISDYNSGAIYANLSAALAAVPQNKQQGGMTVKFILIITQAQYSVVKTENLLTEPSGTLLSEAPYIDSGTYDESQLSTIFSTLPSSTGAGNALTYYVAVTVDETTTYTSWVITKVYNSVNKYIQARFLLSGSFTKAQFTNVDNWQGVDDVPTAGSDNLIKNGGITPYLPYAQKSFKTIQQNINYICFDWAIPAGTVLSFKVTGTAEWNRLWISKNNNDGRVKDFVVKDTVYTVTLESTTNNIGIYCYTLNTNGSIKVEMSVVRSADLDNLYKKYEKRVIIDLTPNEYASPSAAAAAVPEESRKLGTIIMYRSVGAGAKTPLEIWQFMSTNTTSHWSNSLFWNNLQKEKGFYILQFDTDFATTVTKIPEIYRKKGLLVCITYTNKSSELYSFNHNYVGTSTWYDVDCWLSYTSKVYVDEKFATYVPVKLGNNILDLSKIIEGRYMLSDGHDRSNEAYSCTDYIEVEPETLYYAQNKNGTAASNSPATYHCFYNASKQFISSIVAKTTPITTPANCKYIRLSYRSTYVSSQMLSKTLLDYYEPFSLIGGYPTIVKDVSGDVIVDSSIKPNKLADVNFSRLRNGTKVTADTIEGSTIINDDNFPQTLKKNRIINLRIDNLTTFNGIYVGWGRTYDYGISIYVDNTNVYLIKGKATGTKNVLGTHGIAISSFLTVSVICSNSGIAEVEVGSVDGLYSVKANVGNYWSRGNHYLMSDGTIGTGVQLTSSSIDLSNDIWVFGDSYLSIAAQRWPYYINKLGVKNVSWFAFPGATSLNQYDDLLRTIAINKPKYLVWTLGMNDKDGTNAVNSNWNTTLNNIIMLCQNNSITLILATIPNVSNTSYNNVYKNEIVRNSGYRYIDFAKAVNAEAAGATWYASMLSDDNVHPTALGAKTLYSQVLKDFQEILDYDNLEYSIE